MTKLRTVAATFAAMALAAAPIGVASASNSHAGLHGNHCGLGHEKHAHGTHAGLKIGQTCDKADHGGGSGDENTGDDDSGDEGGEA